MEAPGKGICVGALLIMTCCLFVAGEQVADDIIYTDVHKTVKRGNEIMLKCQFHGAPVAVYWMKVDNPDQSLDLTSWVEGKFTSGSCLSTNVCGMDGNYSLIIRNAQIAHQGRYICRVSNYLGILIDNYTDVKIYAPPNKPYPVIKHCVDAEPNNLTSARICSISSDNPIKITCMAFGYFPDVELFFLHGSERMATINTNEWTNDDGTKNKSISIKGSASDTPYVCVASAIPGFKGQETATITITFLSVPTLNSDDPSAPAPPIHEGDGNKFNDHIIVKTVVPMVAIVAVVGIVISLACLWRRYQQGRGTEETHVEESMPMVQKRPKKDPGLLQKPVSQLEVKDFVRRLTGRHCWRLAKYLEISLEDRVNKIIDENNEMLFDTESMISNCIVHLDCSDYKKRCKMDDLLLSIGRYDMTDFWTTISPRKKPHPGNKNFDCQSICDDDLTQLTKLLQCLSSDDRKSISNMLKISCKEEKQEKINLGKKEVRELINSDMIAKSEETSLEDVIKHLHSLVKDTMDMTYVFDVTDDELTSVAVHVTQGDKREMLLSSLGIDGAEYKNPKSELRIVQGKEKKQAEDPAGETKGVDVGSTTASTQDDIETSFGNGDKSQKEQVFVNLLMKWRDEHDRETCRKALRDTLKMTGCKECIVNKNPGTHIYEAELVRIAYNMLMKDVLPFIEAMGMDPNKVCRYKRPVQDLEKGSLGLLLKLGEIIKSDEHRRRKYCLDLTAIGYVDLAQSIYLDNEQSLSEMYSIVSLLDEPEFEGFIDKLSLRKDVVAECTSPDGQLDRLKIMWMWKNQIRPVPCHYRAVVVTGLKEIGRESLADKVIQGQYREKKPEDDVIRDICSRLNDVQFKNLCEKLQLEADEDRERSTRRVVGWVSKWMNEFVPAQSSWISWKSGSNADILQQHREKNNTLLRAGFSELANEIMTLEYCVGADI